MAHFLWNVFRVHLLLLRAQELYFCHACAHAGAGIPDQRARNSEQYFGDHLWGEQVFKRSMGRSLESALFHGRGTHLNGFLQHFIWNEFLDSVFRSVLGLEWLVSRMGLAAMRASSHPLVFAKREGDVVGFLEHLS